MIISGDNAKRPGSYAVENVKTILETALGIAPYDATFSVWGGVLVFDNFASATKALNSKRPMLVLEIGDVREDSDGVIANGRRHLVEVSIEVVTGPYCTPAEALLKDALVWILEHSVDALDALGLEESEIRAGQGRNENPARVNPHTLFLAVHTAN